MIVTISKMILLTKTEYDLKSVSKLNKTTTKINIQIKIF